MSNAVLKEQLISGRSSYASLCVLEGGRGNHYPLPAADLFLLGSLLCILQVLDGILTATGVATFGLYAEGNPMLRTLMASIGYIPAIFVTKATCIGLTIVLCSQARGVLWLPIALRCVAGLYTLMAIVPWTLILASEYLS